MEFKKCLIINSYGGSLVLAAKKLKLDVICSMEDTGFGMDVQRANFPDMPYIERLPWPKQDLKGVMVIAHPPCSSFSNQFAGHKGVDGESFKCHTRVMDYALGLGCASLAIESVPAFLEGARKIHERMGKIHGYNIFRIRQNAVTFGVPQWRPRCWVIFTKLKSMRLWHKPRVLRIEDILQAHGDVLPYNSGITGAFKKMAAVGINEKKIFADILSGEHTGSLLAIGRRILGIDDPGPNHAEVRKRWNLGRRFGVKLPRVLNPEEFGTTILHDSSFFVMGRELFREEYCKLMGFPPDYKWPGQRAKDFRLYLSKGVCPPVAEWILKMMKDNLENDVNPMRSDLNILAPGEIADFQITKKEALERRNK
jgi:site-specific DNA-cytosine methylase